MNETNTLGLSPEKRKRLAFIEGRPDLFETKIFKTIAPEKGVEAKHVLVATRYPGCANALLPVMRELLTDQSVEMDIVTDGRAQEIIQSNFSVVDVTPKYTAFVSDEIVSLPKVILSDKSSSEAGINTYVAATFLDVPQVLVEDYYGTANDLLQKMKDRKIPLPRKICVMDECAKEIVVRRFPDLEGIVEVTGQPIYDKYFMEDTEKRAVEVKARLGLGPADKLVSYMSTLDEPEKIQQVAHALSGLAKNFYFVFRRHPRDNTSYETFKKLLVEAGIRVIDADTFTTDEIGAASDVVLTTWSTAGLEGVYRGKPTVHLVDPTFRVSEDLELPLPQVKLGASVGINQASELTALMPQLLDTDSPLNKNLKHKMDEHYRADGKNA